jgi:hypothetical protein
MKYLNVILLLFLTTSLSFSQGCSDAGFCTMGAMKPDQPYNKRLQFKLRTLEVSQYYGHTHFNNKIYVTTVEANFSLGSKYVFQVKLPYQTAQGHLGTFHSLSDISLSLTRNIISKDAFDVNLTVGTKIPGNNGDKQQAEGFSLPTYYQTSLGTYDLIVGASLINRKWLFAAGYQQALTRSQNGFWIKEWADSKNSDYISQYPQSNHLKRGKDVMLRAERNFRFSKFNASIGALPIWRVNEDVITNPTTLIDEKVSGSSGLALSGIYTLGYNFNVKSGLKLLIGNRFIKRDVNPDGLSREFVSTLTYTYRF